MLQIITLLLFLLFPVFALAETNLKKPASFVFQVEGSNTCLSQAARDGMISTTSDLNITLPRYSGCSRYSILPTDEKLSLNSDNTTWLRLKGKGENVRMIGFGFRLQVSKDGVASIRLKSNGRYFIGYRTTFNL